MMKLRSVPPIHPRKAQTVEMPRRPRTCGQLAESGQAPPKRGRPGGQAVVEFAIVLPILLLMMVGLVNLGVLINAQITLTQAVWEGARAGATLDPSLSHADERIRRAAQEAVAPLLDPRQVGVEIEPDEATRAAMAWPRPRGEPLRVEASYVLDLAFPFPLHVRLSAQAVSRMEYSNPP